MMPTSGTAVWNLLSGLGFHPEHSVCDAGEAPRKRGARNRHGQVKSCSARVLPIQIYSSSVVRYALGARFIAPGRRLLLQCWRSSFQTKISAGFFQIKVICKIEVFFGISGILEFERAREWRGRTPCISSLDPLSNSVDLVELGANDGDKFEENQTKRIVNHQQDCCFN